MDELFPLEHVSREPATATERAPGVVLLHGRGADAHDLLPLAEALPDELHVLSARAPDRLGPGYTWYDLDLSGGGLHASQPDPTGYERSLEVLAEFVEASVSEYNLDPERIGLLGFSQGAILALGSMVVRPGAYAWIVALHGYLPDRYGTEELAAAADTPVFMGAGSRDQVIPAARAEASADRLTHAGVDVTFRTYSVGHGTAPQEVQDVGEWIAGRSTRAQRS